MRNELINVILKNVRNVLKMGSNVKDVLVNMELISKKIVQRKDNVFNVKNIVIHANSIQHFVLFHQKDMDLLLIMRLIQVKYKNAQKKNVLNVMKTTLNVQHIQITIKK